MLIVSCVKIHTVTNVSKLVTEKNLVKRSLTVASINGSAKTMFTGVPSANRPSRKFPDAQI